MRISSNTDTKTNKLLKPIICCILILSLAAYFYPPKIAAKAPKTLTMDEAVFLAIRNSSTLKDIKTDLLLKQIELRQAKEAIRDIRRKESTVKFSLLFNIELPQKHGLPKEIDLVMKVPKIENNITELNEKIKYETQNTKFEAESTYMDTVELMDSVELNTTLLNNLKSTLKRIEVEYKKGKASKEDYDFLKKELEKQTTSLRKEIMRYDNSKKKLGEMIGIDLQAGYSFSRNFSYLSLDREALRKITDYAVGNDFELFRAIQERKIAERNLQELRNIYNNRWGNMVSILENELSKNREIDYKTFLDKYHKALDNIESPWRGSYKIRLFFFTIKIPKEWFQGEYDGIRYFEDEKYALFLSVIERDKARKAEAQARKDLITKIEDTYLTVKELDIAYTESIKYAQDAKIAYEKAKVQNKLGKITFQELESEKNNVIQSESTVFSNLLKYNKTISMFNFYASGAVDKYRSGTSFDRNEYGSGDSFNTGNDQDESSDSKPRWYIKVPVTDLKFTFNVSIPAKSGIDATHFALFTEDGDQIGAKTGITNTISHLPIAFKNSTKLLVKLYSGDSVSHEAYIDGAEFDGELNLKQVSSNISFSPGKTVGEWEIAAVDSMFKSKLSLNLNAEYGITHYSVMAVENLDLSGKTDIKKPFEHLSLVFSEPEKLVVKLYKGEQEVTTVILVSENDKNVVKVK